MHEKERHRIILSAVQDRPVVTVQELVALTDSSEATIRRDIAQLHVQKKLRRVRGGAESIHPPQFVGLAGRPFSVNETINIAQKRAIAQKAGNACMSDHCWNVARSCRVPKSKRWQPASLTSSSSCPE